MAAGFWGMYGLQFCQILVCFAWLSARAVSIPTTVRACHFLCLKLSLRVGPSGWFTVDPPSVLRQDAITPWRTMSIS